MKYLKKYNESVRDKMTPKSEEDILKKLDTMSSDQLDKVLDDLLLSYYKQKRTSKVKDYLSMEQPITKDKKIEFLKNLMTNESVRDKMTPKTKEDILQTFKNSDVKKKREMLFKLQKDNFRYPSEFDGFVKKNLNISDWNYIKNKINKNYWFAYELVDVLKKHQLNKLFYILLSKSNLNESVRDKMTPKSEEELKKEMDKLWYHSYYQPDMKQDVLDAINKELEIEKNMWDIDMTPMHLRLLKVYLENDFKFDYDSSSLEIYKRIVQNTLDKVMRKYRLITKWNIKRFDDKYKTDESVRDKMTGKIDKYDEWKRSVPGIAEELENFLNVKVNEFDTKDIKIVFIWGVIPNKILIDWFKNTNAKYEIEEINHFFGDTQIKLKKPKMFESVRDQMTPKSEKEVKKSLKDMTIYQMFKVGVEENLLWVVKHALKKRHRITYGHSNESLFKDMALRKACELGHIDIIKLLLEHGANANTVDSIHRHKYKEISALLNPYRINPINESVRDQMTPKSDEDVKLIMSKMTLEEKLEKGVESDEEFLVKSAIEEGVDLNIKYPNKDMTTGEHYLNKSCALGYLNIAILLLDAGVDLHSNDDLALSYASDCGSVDIVELLISRGANIHADKEYALREAAREGFSDIVQILINNGADVHASDDYPIRWASAEGRIDTVKILLDNGANAHKVFTDLVCNNRAQRFPEVVKLLNDSFLKANESVRDMMTPKSEEDIRAKLDKLEPNIKLLLCTEYGYLSGVKDAIKKGADINFNYRHVLTVALQHGHLDIIKFFLDDIEKLDKSSLNWALAVANKFGKSDVVKLLKSYKNEIYESVRDQMTPKSNEDIKKFLKKLSPLEKLIIGSKQGIPYAVKDALAEGADIHTGNDLPLRYACRNGYIEIVKILLDAGADVHADDDWPLECASLSGHIEIIKLLVDNKANIHAKNDNSLQVAVINGHTEIVRFLLNAGANVHAVDNYDLKMVKKNGYHEIVELIEQYRKTNESVRDLMTPKSEEEIKENIKKLDPSRKLKIGIDNDLLWAVKEATEEGGRNILYYDLEIEPSEDAYEAPIVYAIGMDRTEIAEYLIDAGYDTHRDDYKALKTAVRLKNMKIINKLIEEDNDNPGSLEIALLAAVSRSNIEMTGMFIDRGADVHYRNEAALVYAIGRQNENIIKMLLDEGADLEKAIPQCTPIGKKFAKQFRKEGFFHKLVNFKRFSKTNESVRDKMTPISKEDSKKLYDDMIKSFNPISNDPSLVISWGIQEMLKFMGETRSSMCLVMMGDRYYTALNSLFDSLIVSRDRILEKEWLYWKELKLAYTFSPAAMWLFSKDMDYMSESLVESVRDKMTPKSEEDITDIFNNGNNLLRKNMVRKLFQEKFNNTIEVFDFVISVLGTPIWDRMREKNLGKYHFTKDLLDIINEDEMKQLFKAMIKDKRINESVRDKMTPKSKEEIEINFKKMTSFEKNRLMIDYIRQEDLESILFLLNSGMKVNNNMIRIASNYHKLSAVSLLKYMKDKQKVNESVRDKMTPKPIDNIVINSIIDSILRDYADHSSCFTLDSNGTPRIRHYISEDFMNHKRRKFGSGIYLNIDKNDMDLVKNIYGI